MLLYFRENGTLEAYNTEQLNQGSVSANKIEVLSTLSPTGVMLLSFELPNGQKTPVVCTEIATVEGHTLWSYTMKAPLLDFSGTLKVQACYGVQGYTESEVNGVLTYTPVGSVLASTVVSVTVNRGNAPYTPAYSQNDWNALAQIYQQCRANELASEGWAVGEQDGTEVTSESVYYHNNAKYYCENADAKTDEAEAFALKAEGYAEGKQNGTVVPDTSPYWHHNSLYWAETVGKGYAQQAYISAGQASQSAQTATTKAGEASASAQTATQKATDASNSADDAMEYASDSEQYAGQASQSANSATQSANTATQKAQEASQYAETASQIYQAKQDAVPDTGYPLIVNSKINTHYIPDEILGQVTFHGVWNAQTGVANPAWTSTDLKKGAYWICAGHGGSKTPNGQSSAISFALGDWAIITSESPLTWQKVENTDAVTSVNSRTGAVLTYHTLSAGSTYYVGDTIYNGTNLLLVIANFTYTAGMDYSSYVKSYGLTQSQIEALIDSTYLAGKFEGDDFIVVDENATDTKVAVTLDTDFKPWIVELSGTSGTLSEEDFAKLCGVNSSYTAQVLLNDELYQPNAISSTYDTYVGGTKVITIQKPSGAWTLTTYEAVTSSEKSTWNGKQNAINSGNPLSADYVTETTTKKFVTPSEKSTWNGKSVVSASTSPVTGADNAKSITVNGTSYNIPEGGSGITNYETVAHENALPTPSATSPDIVDVGGHFYIKTILYSVTVTLDEHITGATSGTINKGGTLTLTYTATQGYALPDTITVTNASYTWVNGTLTLSQPTGDVTVTISSLEQLPSPTNLSISGLDLTFDAVDGAETYEVIADNTNVLGESAGEPVQTGETWVFNDNMPMPDDSSVLTNHNIQFTSNETEFTAMNLLLGGTPRSPFLIIIYNDGINDYSAYNSFWQETPYKTVTFASPVDTTTTFGQWLSANATKQ